jgi:hypothetical protein
VVATGKVVAKVWNSSRRQPPQQRLSESPPFAIDCGFAGAFHEPCSSKIRT